MELFWFDNYDEALKNAMQNRRPVLLQFDVKGCGGCKKLYSYTYLDEKVKEELDKYFTLLRLDIVKERDIRRKYNAFWTPSFYFLDYKGNLYYHFHGYFPPTELRILVRVGFSETSIPKGRFAEAKEFLNKDFEELEDNILAPKILYQKGMIDYLHDRDNKKFRALIKFVKKKYPQSPEASQYFWDE